MDSFKKCGLGILFFKAFQGASIKVEEKGTNTAATTCFSFKMGAPALKLDIDPPDPPTEFIAEHPFMFIIREDTSGVVLFIDHVANPSI